MFIRKILFLIFIFIEINLPQNCYSMYLQIPYQANCCLCWNLEDFEEVKKEEIFIIKNQEEWEQAQQSPYFQFINRYTDLFKLKIDRTNFNKRIIVAIFLGIQLPINISFKQVEIDVYNKKIIITLQKIQCNIGVITFPCCIAVLEKRRYPIEFRYEEITAQNFKLHHDKNHIELISSENIKLPPPKKPKPPPWENSNLFDV